MRLNLFSPVKLALIGSLILSLIAVFFEPILGRDASLYIENARIYVEEGASSLLENFSWPWISVLIGLTHEITGLSMISSGYLWIFFFTAGLCGVLVKCAELVRADSGYWAALVVLTMPAHNEYRYQILRDQGFWFFASCSVLFMMLFEIRRKWRYCLLAVMSIILAAMFRLEAIFMLVSMLFVLAWSWRNNMYGSLKMGVMGAAIVTLVIVTLLSFFYIGADLARIDYYLNLIDPQLLGLRVNDLSELFAESILHDTAREDALLVLVFGFLMVILFKAVCMLGVFIIPLVATRSGLYREYFARHAFVSASCVLYLAVLLVFFLHERFVVGRYIVILNLLLVPALALALQSFWRLHRRFAIAVIMLSVVIGLSNVVSTSSKRTHYLKAAAWAQAHVATDAQVYFYDERLGFYSGRGVYREKIDSREALQQLDSYDYFFLDLPLEDPAVQKVIEAGNLAHLATFNNGHDRSLIILGKPRRADQPNP